MPETPRQAGDGTKRCVAGALRVRRAPVTHNFQMGGNLMKFTTTTALVASIAFCTSAFADGHATLPLKELPDIADRDYWVPDEVYADG